jgi:hypothetical protein
MSEAVPFCPKAPEAWSYRINPRRRFASLGIPATSASFTLIEGLSEVAMKGMCLISVRLRASGQFRFALFRYRTGFRKSLSRVRQQAKENIAGNTFDQRGEHPRDDGRKSAA